MFNVSALLLDDASRRRRHWPMARTKCCANLPHSATIACFSWLTVVNRQNWWASRLLKNIPNCIT